MVVTMEWYGLHIALRYDSSMDVILSLFLDFIIKDTFEELAR